MTDESVAWYKVLDSDELSEGRVEPVTCAHVTACMTHFEGQYAALDNRCPHRGGPGGRVDIEEGRFAASGVGGTTPTGLARAYDDGVDGGKAVELKGRTGTRRVFTIGW